MEERMSEEDQAKWLGVCMNFLDDAHRKARKRGYGFAATLPCGPGAYPSMLMTIPLNDPREAADVGIRYLMEERWEGAVMVTAAGVN